MLSRLKSESTILNILSINLTKGRRTYGLSLNFRRRYLINEARQLLARPNASVHFEMTVNSL